MKNKLSSPEKFLSYKLVRFEYGPKAWTFQPHYLILRSKGPQIGFRVPSVCDDHYTFISLRSLKPHEMILDQMSKGNKYNFIFKVSS